MGLLRFVTHPQVRMSAELLRRQLTAKQNQYVPIRLDGTLEKARLEQARSTSPERLNASLDRSGALIKSRSPDRSTGLEWAGHCLRPNTAADCSPVLGNGAMGPLGTGDALGGSPVRGTTSE